MINIKEDLNNDYIKLFGISTPGSKLIMQGDDIVGMIDFNVYDNRVKINYITVSDNYRRKGIAKVIIEQLKDENKGKYIYGDALPGAMKFWESMGAEFHEDPDDDYCTPFIIEY